MKAIQHSSFGDADVLSWGAAEDPASDAEHVVVALHAAGLNFADVYRRQGYWFAPFGEAPWIPGMEGSGVIVDLGPSGAAAGLEVGQRVGWCDNSHSNAELVAVEIDKLIPLPDDISLEAAASVLLQGLTAYFLTHDSHDLRAGEWCVVHAGAGGVGLLLTQVIKRAGAHVISIASTQEKRDACLQAGADLAIGREDWVARVREATGEGADVVFDSVGSTVLESLEATRSGGRVVFYGMAGGEPPAVSPMVLMDRSLTLTGGDLWNVLTTAQKRRSRAAELFSWIAAGEVLPRIAKKFALRDAAEAHRYIESRSTIGKVLLVNNDGHSDDRAESSCGRPVPERRNMD